MPTSQVIGTPRAFASATTATPAALESRAMCTRAPVVPISSMMVRSATVSATTGIGGNPRRVATSPSCATPPLACAESSARSQTVKPKVAAY